jgi:hypothetical protein
MAKEKKGSRVKILTSLEIWHLARQYGITRDQARRLIRKVGSDQAKLADAARILKARGDLPRRSKPSAARAMSPRAT